MSMDAEQRKRKRFVRPSSSSSLSSSPHVYYYFWWVPILCCFLFVFFFVVFFAIYKENFRPVLIGPRVLSASNSVQGEGRSNLDLALRVEDRVLFPDHLLLLLKTNPSLFLLHQTGELDCVYRSNSGLQVSIFPVDAVDDYDGYRTIVRCQLPPANCSAMVTLRSKRRRTGNGEEEEAEEEKEEEGFAHPIRLWDSMAYEGYLDGETAVVFVKGLNLRPDRVSDPTQFSCHFGWDLDKSGRLAFTTRAVTAAQEVIRCSLPLVLRKNPAKARGIGVTVGGGGAPLRLPLPSVAKLFNPPSRKPEKRNQNKNKKRSNKKKKFELCVCTMVWNQAAFLREWVLYHAWLGVERWFIYDNNSDDDIKLVLHQLQQESYNVSRHVWPWIKTQEAGFSHCALRARDECQWVGFMDVDEFFYFPLSARARRLRIGGKFGYQIGNSSSSSSSLGALIANFSSSALIGEIRTTCHSFGPSGLSKPPLQGVTVGYTCRLQSPERHKSFVQPEALDSSLLNVVHHFRLRRGFKYMNLPQSSALINHYKYQVWEVFRSKFFRRVATYVADWHENQNEGSKDRAPGLGTEAIEPPNWRLQFCEVWDSGLRDFVVSNLAEPSSGLLPWENPLL